MMMPDDDSEDDYGERDRRALRRAIAIRFGSVQGKLEMLELRATQTWHTLPSVRLSVARSKRLPSSRGNCRPAAAMAITSTRSPRRPRYWPACCGLVCRDLSPIRRLPWPRLKPNANDRGRPPATPPRARARGQAFLTIEADEALSEALVEHGFMRVLVPTTTGDRGGGRAHDRYPDRHA